MRQAGVIAFLVGAVLPCVGLAEPPLDGDGPYTANEMMNVSIPLAGQTLTVDLFAPQSAPPAPIIVGAHGLDSSKAALDGWGTHLATHGFAVAIPTFPSSDNNAAPANAASENALLDWMTAQGSVPGSFYYGLVDGTRRGIFGHSMGGLVEFLAAAASPAIQVAVGFDPVDVNSMAANAVPQMQAIPVVLRASTQSICNAAAPAEPAVIAAFPGPYLVLTVANTMHCDPCDPDDTQCDLSCSVTVSPPYYVSPNRAALLTFRRYATAAFRYLLLCDPDARTNIDGMAEQADVTAGTVTNVTIRSIPPVGTCGSSGTDAGIEPTDAGETIVDAGSSPVEDAGEVEDAGTQSGGDASDLAPDAGAADGGGIGSGSLDGGASSSEGDRSSVNPGGCRCSGFDDFGALALLGLIWRGRSTLRRRRQ
jgi:dienelactone hydrolase